MAHKGSITVPKFGSEAEEAQWWYENRATIEGALIKAMDNGTFRRGAASRNVTIRMAEADLALARHQAQARGMPYQTYIKSLLHEALVKRQHTRSS